MPTTALTRFSPDPLVTRLPSSMDHLVSMAVATCASPATRRMYRSQLSRFIASGHPLNREGVAFHVQAMRDSGASPATLISIIASIRKLATEAHIRQLLTSDELAQIRSVMAPKAQKTRAGLWLTIEQVRDFLAMPDRATYWGKRDAALLACMVGCGLRRSEMAALTWDRYQAREGRYCFVDLIGKGNKLRTVPVPTWAQPDVDAWHTASRLPAPPAIQHANLALIRHCNLTHVMGGLSHDSIHHLIQQYGNRAGLHLNPHDLRRTLAKLLRKSGTALEQIQLTLGHADIRTTTIYLGSELELEAGKAAVDKLALGGEHA